MTDTVAARVTQMRSVAFVMESNATAVGDFHRSIQALASALLVDDFAFGALNYAAEMTNELPAVAAILRNRANAAEAADQGGSSAVFDSEFSLLTGNLEVGLGNLIGAAGTDGDLARHFGRLEFSPQPDLGGTYTQEYRGGFIIDGSDSVGAGRALIENLLLTTADATLIGKDEFQLISVNGGESFVLVLAGVTDLKNPHLGLNPDHRTVRDMDMYALPSAANTSIADNEYARMVRSALNVAEIPFGADIAIVGHSYGADTALDLAADADFNGGQFGYNVTHVVAAGYNSGPQLKHVSDSTEVLVLQNHNDLAVIGEIAAETPNQVIQAAADLDPVGGVTAWGLGVKNRVWDVGDAVADTGQFAGGLIVNGGSAAINQSAEWLGIDDRAGTVDWGDFDDIYLIEDGVDNPTDHQTVVVFERDFELSGIGHKPVYYADHVDATNDPSTVDFFESFADAGYTGTMDRWSVDVSVPE